MDRGLGGASGGNAPTLRSIALDEIARTRWVPASGENRIRGMIENRPDWVVSRQRAWGVPIAVFVRKGTSDILIDDAVNARIADAFEKEGADAWYKDDAAARFLAPEYSPNEYEKIDDILDVWLNSGSTHAFTLDDPERFPGLAGLKRVRDGGRDEIMYLEGSDQHRGWFHSSLLDSCGTRLRAPFDVVLTHGFTLDEQGRKMSKSLGNVTVPQKVISRIRRRYPAAVGRERRLFRRSAHRPGNLKKHQPITIANYATHCVGCLAPLHISRKMSTCLPTEWPELER